jgi:hypothetical protein
LAFSLHSESFNFHMPFLFFGVWKNLRLLCLLNKQDVQASGLLDGTASGETSFSGTVETLLTVSG